MNTLNQLGLSFVLQNELIKDDLMFVLFVLRRTTKTHSEFRF